MKQRRRAAKTAAGLTALLLAAVSLLTACRGFRAEEADVHVFYYSYSDTYVSTVRAALDRELAGQGITFQDYDGNASQTIQTEQIQTAVTKGARALVVNVVNTGSDDAAAGLVRLAKSAGIPILFFNREVSDEVVNRYENAAFVGTDAAEAGRLQGEMIGTYVQEHFRDMDLNGDGVISYVLFKGEEGNNEAIYRTRYAVENADALLKKTGHPALRFYDSANQNRYLVDKNGQWSAAAANEYLTTALASYNEKNKNMIELVIANNDGMAEGAISALTAAGYNTGAAGGRVIPVFGVDATEAAQELIRKGRMTGTVRQDAVGMAQALTLLAKNGMEGKAILTGTEVYTVDTGAAKIRIPYAPYWGDEEESGAS